MTARVEAERAIADVLAGHRPLPFTIPPVLRCRATDCHWEEPYRTRGMTVDEQHRAHVASVLADLMAERQAEALNEVARWLGTVYQVNPMNHDGSNHTIDRVVQHLDRQAGTNAPSRAFEDAWDERMDKYEADYYGGDGKQRRERRALARAATDRRDPKDTPDE